MRVEFVSITYTHLRHAVSTLFMLLLGLLAWLLSSLVLIVLTRWLVGNLWEPLGLNLRSVPGELWLAQSQVRVWKLSGAHTVCHRARQVRIWVECESSFHIWIMCAWWL